MGIIHTCLLPDDCSDIDYDDYIFNHQELLKIKLSEFLARHLKKGDYIVLEININGASDYHTCLVKKVCKNYLYVALITPVLNARRIKYIKNVKL